MSTTNRSDRHPSNATDPLLQTASGAKKQSIVKTTSFTNQIKNDLSENRINKQNKMDNQKNNKTKEKKPRRRDKSDLGENFIAPDGGMWAWLVCIAAGVSNLSVYPCLQQFGFIFREHLLFLGLTSPQITTLINTNNAISACTGLLNGPMFRRFTYRQVGLVGSLLIFAGLFLTAFCDTFVGYILAYSLLYAFGMGISVSSSSLAINTYFKNRRRRATGFSWTITGLGPILLPHLVTFLLPLYGVRDTVFIFAAFSLHTAAAALIYEPVRYHAPKPLQTPEENTLNNPKEYSPNRETQIEHSCKYCEMEKQRRERFGVGGIFSSQYLYQDDDEDKPGYEIIEPGTPMLSRANDGWFGSKLSLASQPGSFARFRTVSSARDLEAITRSKAEDENKSEEFFKPNNFKRERDEVLGHSSSKTHLNRERSLSPARCTCLEERTLMELNEMEEQSFEMKEKGTNADNSDDLPDAQNISCMQKVFLFFDLDLLRDITYVNLVIGLTAINFGELNFSILTPFILSDFGLTTSQITIATSVLGTLDVIMRFLVPFITEHIAWDNRIFFLIGVIGIAIGRTVVACTRSFEVILVCFIFMGICKGVRTIFWPLIIPSYVPLKRLPAASGLQLLITGLFSLAAGPFVGVIRDHYDYAITLHCLNLMSFIAAASWGGEALIRRILRKKQK